MKLIYDIASCPMTAGLSMDKVVKIYKEHNIVLYDSKENGGNEKPQLIDVLEGTDIKIVDMSTEEGKKIINKLKI